MQLTILINYFSSAKLGSLKVLNDNKVILKDIPVSVPSNVVDTLNNLSIKTVEPNNELFEYDETKSYSEMYYQYLKQFSSTSINNKKDEIILAMAKVSHKTGLPVDKKSFVISEEDGKLLIETLKNNTFNISTTQNKLYWFKKSLTEKSDINRSYDAIIKREFELNDDMNFYSNVSAIEAKRQTSKSNLIIHKNKDLNKSLNHIESLAIEEVQSEFNDVNFDIIKKA